MGEAPWFRVSSQALGIWMLLEMFGELRTIIGIELGWFKPTSYPFGLYVMHFIFSGAIGVYLVWGAHHFSELVCGAEKRGFEVHPLPDQSNSDADVSEGSETA